MYSILLMSVLSTVPGQQPAYYAAPSAGCSGYSVAAASAGCVGSRPILDRLAARRAHARAALFPGLSTRLVPVAPAVAVPAVAEDDPQLLGAGGLLTRVRVERQLRRALASGEMTPQQAATVRKVMTDSDAWNAVTGKVHRDLQKQMRASGHVAAIGDGTILKILIDSLPQILAFIEALVKILDLFTFLPPPASFDLHNRVGPALVQVTAFDRPWCLAA